MLFGYFEETIPLSVRLFLRKSEELTFMGRGIKIKLEAQECQRREEKNAGGGLC